jgi:signal transduction histidine kinase
LLGELSDIAKLDAGTAALSESPFDLFNLIQDLAKDVHEAEEHGVHLELGGASHGALVVADRTRMANAFSVFFRAVLREQPSAAIVVADRRLDEGPEGSRAVVVVARQEAVQKTYEASPTVLDELRGGLGLALPLARRVIERYGGKVWTPALGETDQTPDRVGLVVSLPLATN